MPFSRKEAAALILARILPDKLPPITGGETAAEKSKLRGIVGVCVDLAVQAAEGINNSTLD